MPVPFLGGEVQAWLCESNYFFQASMIPLKSAAFKDCLLYTSDAADE